MPSEPASGTTTTRCSSALSKPPTAGSASRRSSIVCVGIVVIWLASAPLFSNAKSWQVVIHTVASVLTLLLLVLLENAGRRDAEAAQEKLNVLAEALAALMDSRAADDPEVQKAADVLRDAIGLEGRH